MVIINKKEYKTNEDEFKKIEHKEFSNLNIINNVGLLERLVSLINELSGALTIENLIVYKTSHGGYIPLNCSKNYKNVFLVETSKEHSDNIKSNIELLSNPNPQPQHLNQNIHLLEFIDNIDNITNIDIFSLSNLVKYDEI